MTLHYPLEVCGIAPIEVCNMPGGIIATSGSLLSTLGPIYSNIG